MTLGEVLRVTLTGTSHGPFVGAVVEGVPAGIVLDTAELSRFMELRKTGGKFSSQRTETDEVAWLHGLVEGKTNGEPIELRILNQNSRSSDYDFLPQHPRPGHQDMVMWKRMNGQVELSGGGISSARLTAPLVAIAALLRPWLSNFGICVEAHLGGVGNVEAKKMSQCPQRWASDDCRALRCRDPIAAKEMATVLEHTKASRDSIGSRVDVEVTGLPLGLGEPWFDGIEPALARAFMAIPAARGVEFGYGFAVQSMHGSTHNSPWAGTPDHPIQEGEHPDGALAGLATGSPLEASIAFKPPSSIPQPQLTLNLDTGEKEPLIVKGRHDPVLGPRAVAVVEAMAILVVSDLLIRGGFHHA